MFALQDGYIETTDWLQIAFGLLSRSRSTLRLARAVVCTKDRVATRGRLSLQDVD